MTVVFYKNKTKSCLNWSNSSPSSNLNFYFLLSLIINAFRFLPQLPVAFLSVHYNLLFKWVHLNCWLALGIQNCVLFQILQRLFRWYPRSIFHGTLIEAIEICDEIITFKLLVVFLISVERMYCFMELVTNSVSIRKQFKNLMNLILSYTFLGRLLWRATSTTTRRKQAYSPEKQLVWKQLYQGRVSS